MKGEHSTTMYPFSASSDPSLAQGKKSVFNAHSSLNQLYISMGYMYHRDTKW
jgi:hypothetical protein